MPRQKLNSPAHKNLDINNNLNSVNSVNSPNYYNFNEDNLNYSYRNNYDS